MSGKLMMALAAALLLPACWGALALWYKAAGNEAVRALAALLWLLASVALLAAGAFDHRAAALLLFVLAFALLLLWWHSLRPSNLRLWAADVAQMTHGEVDGERVLLHNVRNFDWRSPTECSVRWQTRHYRLDRLAAVDLILSYWTISAIAHVLVSFCFQEGERVAFSVEIRRQRDQAFSAIGGFFKQFELSIIAADERDVIRVRTNVRGEDDYLYRLRLPPAAMRSLFLGYIDQANRLLRAPRFYNTITANCTTLIFRMMQHIVGRLPLDPRLLFSGYLAGYVYRVGGLDRRYPLSQLREFGRITQRARAAAADSSFSEAIRRGIPSLAG
jgi:hypothetical protein